MMRGVTQQIASIGVAVLGLGVLFSCTREQAETEVVAEGTVQITGAGATFPAPLYKQWIAAYEKEHPAVRFSYDAVGSGEGIKRFIAGTVDFGASDVAMQDEEIRQVEQGGRIVPATAGMVVLAYNIWGLEGEIKLKRDVYVDIFWGKIKKWNDPRIKESNPTLTLPKVDITPVVRLDSSGTTYAFTHHLSAISEAWRDAGPGVGKLIDWPGRAMVARGNAGVARRVKLSAGAIGYIEYSFAKRLGLPMAWLENKAGRFVKPDAQSGQLALAGGSAEPGHFRLFIPDPEGEASYPIITYSWLLLYDRYSDSAKVSVLKDFVWWGLTQGQDDSTELGYVPLPKEVVSQARSAVDKIHE